MSEKRKTPLEPEEITVEMCSSGLRLQILGQVPFFGGLKPGELQEINRLFREQGFEPGETIYFEGDPAQRLYVVAAGQVKLMRHTSTGKDVLLDLLNPGEFFGSLLPLAQETYPETAQAHTTTCTLNISKTEFRSILASRPAVTMHVLELVTERLQAAQEMVRQLSAHPVEYRIAFTLLKLADKFGSAQPVGLLIQTPLSREDLGELTGTTTKSASRVISQFQKNGLIHTGRQWIAITDRAGLEALLSEN